MTARLRVLDSGVRGARDNLAVTAALAERHRNGAFPETLRFQHFRPAAIIGRHQLLSQEVHLDHCRAQHIETARRQTGGGAIYMGPGMLGFELIVSRGRVPGALDAVTATLCTALAEGLQRLGVEARFRPRNDIEVAGRKISGTGGYIDGGTLVFQGTVLVEFDIADMAAALVLPVDKLDRKGLQALSDRVTSLQALLGAAPPMRDIEIAVADAFAHALGLPPQWTDALTGDEEAAAAAAFAREIGCDDFVAGDSADARNAEATARLQTAGGTIAVLARLRGGQDRLIDRIWITGDFFATPPRVIPDLEAALAGCRLAAAADLASTFLARAGAELLGAMPGDIVQLVGQLAVGPTSAVASARQAEERRSLP